MRSAREPHDVTRFDEFFDTCRDIPRIFDGFLIRVEWSALVGKYQGVNALRDERERATTKHFSRDRRVVGIWLDCA